jgi:hypothetical protein
MPGTGRTGSAKRVIVILSSAKDLEILRLKPQNDVVGQALNPPFSKWAWEAVSQFTAPVIPDELRFAVRDPESSEHSI